MNVIYKEWKYGEVTALGAALVMYQSHLGHGAFSWIFSDLVILRAKGDFNPSDFNPSGRNVAGYHTSYDPNFNYRSSITLTDARVKRFGDPVWTFTHEIAHNLVMDRASAVNYSIQENYQDLIWRGELNPETGPTYVSILYTPSEDLAESITTYLWDHYSADWISQLPTYQQNIHGNSIYSKYVFQPLDTDRINWIEDFFDVIMGAYQE